ncbi:hypothetical protein [Legionella donaldsonii]|uniref:hypothetical protein n=1 Tax=Legionella donaldsonii TaxID=45060 RepID=UPI000E1BBA35|nr:hypothetical protein [Legionella donaldsonii]
MLAPEKSLFLFKVIARPDQTLSEANKNRAFITDLLPLPKAKIMVAFLYNGATLVKIEVLTHELGIGHADQS